MSEATPKDGFRPNLAELKINVEQSKIRADLWHKLLDRLLSSEFFSFFLVLLITISGLVFMSVKTELNEILDYWKIILPVITLYMGYALGKKSN